ncbi:MAG: AraC family transcriptional regulator [Lentisphaerae bacterium]|nr:MAG: AraC family transcriptional regulator [Lentisphaerota bacterium]
MSLINTAKGVNLMHDKWKKVAMAHTRQKTQFKSTFWLLDQEPAGSRVWLFKSNRVHCNGTFYSYQLPSGITLRQIARGSGKVRVTGQIFTVEKGDLFCAVPGVPIEFYEDPTNPWAWLEIQLRGEGAMDIVYATGCHEQRPVARPEDPDSSLAAIDALVTYFEDREQRTPFGVLARLYAWIETFSGKEQQPHTPLKRSWHIVEEAKMILDSEASPNLNVSQLAAKLNISRSTLLRAFHQELGMAAVRWLRRHRLERSQALLAATSLPVREIATASGFSDSKYFIRCFTREFGMSPTQWRRSHSS